MPRHHRIRTPLGSQVSKTAGDMGNNIMGMFTQGYQRVQEGVTNIQTNGFETP